MCLHTPASTLKKIVFCTQSDTWTDTRTDGQMEGQTDRLIPVYPKKHWFYEGIKIPSTSVMPLQGL